MVEKAGYAGTKVDTYRSVYEADGTLAYTEYIASSSYYGGDAVIRRGTAEPSPEPSDSPSPSPSEPAPAPSEEPAPSESPAESPAA